MRIFFRNFGSAVHACRALVVLPIGGFLATAVFGQGGGQNLLQRLEFGFRGLAHADAFMPVAVVLKGDASDRVVELRINGDPSVRRRVELPRQTQKIVHLYTRLEAVRNAGGRPLFSIFEGRNQLGETRRLDGVQANTIVPVVGGASWGLGVASSPVLDEALLPDRPRGYDGLSALVVYPDAWNRISRAAATAIATWVGRGGRLILPTVQGGAVLQLPKNHPLGPLRARPSKTYQGFCRRLEEWILKSEIEEDPWIWDRVTTTRPPEHAYVHLPAWKGGPPVFASTEFGHGHMAFLSFDPVAPNLKKWSGRNRTVGEILDRSLTMKQPRLPPTVVPAGEQIPPAVDAWIFQQDESRRVLWPFVLFLIIYLALIGPGDYLLVRHFGKPRLTWLTFSAVVATFTFLAWSKGRERITRMEYREVSFIDYSEPDKPGLGRSFIGVYSDTNGSLNFRPLPPGGEVKRLGAGVNVSYTVDDRVELLRQKLFVWAFHGYQVSWQEAPMIETTFERQEDGGIRLHVKHALPRAAAWVAFVHEGTAYYLNARAFSDTEEIDWDLERSEHVTRLGGELFRRPGSVSASEFLPDRSLYESWLVVLLDDPWPSLEIEGRTPRLLGQCAIRCRSFEVAK